MLGGGGRCELLLSSYIADWVITLLWILLVLEILDRRHVKSFLPLSLSPFFMINSLHALATRTQTIVYFPIIELIANIHTKV